MGLFGALFAGVSGLDSQSNKIGIISNNISNVNTVGFKQGQASFDTLVVPSGSTSFSPGGVIGDTQQLVNEQGLIQATSSATDIAISGNGLFVVNTAADGSGNTLYTRSGSFTEDSSGNFVNSDGYYLQGIPVTVPPTSLNSSALKTVSVNQGATGTATATTVITMAATLNASQTPLLGSGEVANLALNDTVNKDNTAADIIVPVSNNLTRGDTFSISTSGSADSTASSATFTYGGFSTSRNVTATINGTTTTGNGDGGNTLDPTESLVAGDITNVALSTTVSVTVAHPADYTVGSYIYISGVTAGPNGIPASDINGEQVVTGNGGGAGPVTFTAAQAGVGAVATTGASITATNRTYAFTGNIMNATTETGDFLAGVTDASSTFATDALQFKIATANGGTSTFTYNAEPNTNEGQFNSLDTLADAINSSSNSTLTANVVQGRLYVSATDANQAVTFSNGNAAGSGGLPGIDWTQELDLPTAEVANINAGSVTAGVNFYNTLNGLAAKINAADPTNLTATVKNAATDQPTVNINANDPESTITFTDTSITTVGGSLINELGFSGPGGAPLTVLTSKTNTTTLPILYSPGTKATDMSSGAVTPQFQKSFVIYDSLGIAHSVNLNLSKVGVHQWAMELTGDPAGDVVSANNDGQIAFGTLTFDGNGNLTSVTGSIATPDFTIAWNPVTVGASPSSMTVDLFPSSTNAGLTQQSTSSATSTSASAATGVLITPNGSPIGQLTGVAVNSSGFVTATFSNGQTQELFQIPLASVSNPNGLEAASGDAYSETLASGPVTLDAVGQGGTGSLTASALEESNVDLSTQLTDLIVAQQAYGANSKVLTIADTLLQELDQIIQ